MSFWRIAWRALVCLLALGGALSADEMRAETRVDTRALTLIDQDGTPTSLHALEGHAVVLHFIFTHCVAACPMQVRNLRTVREALDADTRSQVQFVSVSIDPEHDTPDVLRRFARAQGITDANWRFVTASPEVIEQLTRYFSVKHETVADGQINHTLAIFLFDASGRLIQRYADPVDTVRLAREIAGVDRLAGTPSPH